CCQQIAGRLSSGKRAALLFELLLAEQKKRAATNKISRTAASGYGRGARAESEPWRFRGRSRGIEAMLNPLEIRRDKQLRRRRREGTRRQNNRRANRAVIVIIAWILRRCLLRRVSERRLSCYERARTAAKAAQVHVTKGQHDLERQRDQRQH